MKNTHNSRNIRFSTRIVSLLCTYCTLLYTSCGRQHATWHYTIMCIFFAHVQAQAVCFASVIGLGMRLKMHMHRFIAMHVHRHICTYVIFCTISQATYIYIIILVCYIYVAPAVATYAAHKRTCILHAHDYTHTIHVQYYADALQRRHTSAGSTKFHLNMSPS